MVREVRLTDAEDITLIYNYYIENTVITFEEEKVSVDEITKRIKEYTALYPWFVFEEDKKVSVWKIYGIVVFLLLVTSVRIDGLF